MMLALYIASAVGAASIFLMMPPRSQSPRALGVLLGAAALGGLWLYLAQGGLRQFGIEPGAFAYYYVFSAIAIGAAARVITHTRPVYSALWFVLVVLASAGLFLVLGAEFMAVAMIIIYAGAILVTYVFVIMLAATAAGETNQVAEEDRTARDPAAAVLAGFILLATLLSVYFDRQAWPARDPAAAAAVQTREHLHAAGRVLSRRPATQLAETLRERGHELPHQVTEDLSSVRNVEWVGLDLFQSHPLGIELAGVILLVALVGAVVIARKRVEPAPVPEQRGEA